MFREREIGKRVKVTSCLHEERKETRDKITDPCDEPLKTIEYNGANNISSHVPEFYKSIFSLYKENKYTNIARKALQSLPEKLQNNETYQY